MGNTPSRYSTKQNKSVLFRVPRILAILYIFFISIFAFDSIQDGFYATIIHLIPSFILIIVTFIARKKEYLGATLFVILMIFGFIFFHNDFDTNLILFGPLLIIAALFMVEKHYNN